MAEVIRMPRMSDTMEEGVIVDWFKKVGDKLNPGDVMAEVETDKATMELESFQEGTLLYVGVEKGDAVPVEGILAIIGEEGEDYKKLLEEEKKKQAEKAEDDSEEAEEEGTEEKNDQEEKEEAKEEKKESSSVAKAAPQHSAVSHNGTSDGERIKASPLAKAMAKEKGIDLAEVEGSGDDGRIVKRDIENYQPKKAEAKEGGQVIQLPKVVAEESSEEIKVSQMRKTIAKRLAQSKFSAPHFYLTMEIEMDSCMAARKAINESSPVKISFNDIIVKACAIALRQHPQVNSSWQGDTIKQNHHVHIGVAVAIDEGLVVPVIRFADNKTLSHLASEVKQLAEKGRNKKLQPDEMQGGTFSVSNLGMFGIDEFTAIINPPEACILAVGGIKEVPVMKDGQLASKNLMKVTLSCDHRVVDGATGAQFLQTLKALIEEPVRLLI